MKTVSDCIILGGMIVFGASAFSVLSIAGAASFIGIIELVCTLLK